MRAIVVDTGCWEASLGEGPTEAALARVREENPGVIVQFFKADEAPNPAAIELLAAQTLAASRSGATLAQRPELDLLLRLAGTRQIGEAFERAGYRSKKKRIFLVAASEGAGSLRQTKARVAKDARFSEIPKRELSGVDLALVERGALLSVGA